VAATARRVVVPSVLLALVNQMFDSQPDFDRVALALLGIFPFTLMFLVTSVAMLRERTGGTLERLLTMPMSKLDLLLGYGLAFAVAAAAQALVTCATAYWLLDLYTPGSPLLVVGVAIAGAVLGMAIGLLTSAFATSEFQAVQFMPVVVLPQILLGGLFVPRERMADWLEAVSDALPLSYSIDALDEVGRTGLVTADLVRDIVVIVLAALAALALAATTLRRRSGDPERSPKRRAAVLLAVLLVAGSVGTVLAVDAARYVTTDNAAIDGEQLPIVARVGGTLVGWRATLGSRLREGQPVGRIQQAGGFARPQTVLRAPADGTVVVDDGVEGAFVPAGTRLAVAYDLTRTYVTARVEDTDLGAVRARAPVDLSVDAAPGVRLSGQVVEVQGGTAAQFSGEPAANTTGRFDRVTQVVAVRVAILDRQGLTLVPGMNVTARIHKE
jgi:ABC-2 type transport system permease protein